MAVVYDSCCDIGFYLQTIQHASTTMTSVIDHVCQLLLSVSVSVDMGVSVPACLPACVIM